MAAGARDLERSLRRGLSAHVAEVRARRREEGLRRGLGPRKERLAAEVVEDREPALGRTAPAPRRERGLAAVARRHDRPRAPPVAQGEAERERTAHRSQAAVERELADEARAVERLGWELARRRQDRCRDREV